MKTQNITDEKRLELLTEKYNSKYQLFLNASAKPYNKYKMKHLIKIYKIDFYLKQIKSLKEVIRSKQNNRLLK